MSSKSSPTKREDKSTLSPTKKDDKATSSLILTRNQSSFLNTRQLRNKASSRKKISEFTQQLLSPLNSKFSQSHKKKSSKDKDKAKPNIKKKVTVSVSKLVLDMKKDGKLAGKKHKIISEPKEVKSAKRARLSAPAAAGAGRGRAALTAQEMIELCEEQSLDDDDFLEILTCESPVWWEETPNDGCCEDELFTKADEMRYFQEICKQTVKAEPIDTTNIIIPTVKQKDDKFMKKRSKLEDLLGNIKTKLTDTTTEVKNNILSDVDKKMQTSKANDISARAKDKLIKQEQEYQRNKSLSESTSSSEDLFFGFQNEEVLKDFENMDIPIKNNKKEMENKYEQNIEIKETIVDTKPKEEIDTKAASRDTTTVNSFLESSKHITDCSKKEESLCDEPELNTQKCLPSDSHKSIRTRFNETKNCQNNSDLMETNKFDSVNIYYIDTTNSKSNEKISVIKTNSQTNESNLSKPFRFIEETEKTSSILNEVKPHYVPNSSETKTQSNVSKNDIKSAEMGEKTGASSTSNKSGESDKNNTTNEERESKSNKPKQLFKDQLMAVYKIITNENYRDNFKKAITNEVEKINTNANWQQTLRKGNDRKSHSNKRSLLRPIQEAGNSIGDLNNKDKTERKTEVDAEKDTIINANKIDTKANNTNGVNKETKGEVDEEKCNISVMKIDSESNQVQNNEQPKFNKSSNVDETDCKESKKDTVCGNRDGTNTEGSLNITSNVKSAKYCLKCSSIFETETCSYCAKKSQVIQDNRKNGCQQPCKS